MKLFDIKVTNPKLQVASQLDDKLALLGIGPIAEGRRLQNIPKTQMSARFDSGNTNTLTQDHAHIFARSNGRGKELYSVNKSGTGHDGSSGKVISPKVAEFLRSQGFRIPENCVLENLDLNAALEDSYLLIVYCESKS